MDLNLLKEFEINCRLESTGPGGEDYNLRFETVVGDKPAIHVCIPVPYLEKNESLIDSALREVAEKVKSYLNCRSGSDDR